MRILKSFYFVLVLMYATACNKEERAKKLPIESFFKNSAKTAFLISPDGKNISYLKDRIIYVQAIDGTNTRQITTNNDRISAYYWANSNMLFYKSDRSEDGNERITAISADGKNQHDLLKGSFKINLINPNRIRNNELLVTLNKRDSAVFDVYRLNIAKQTLNLVVQNPGNITEWYVDSEGQLRLAVSSDGVDKTLLFRESENGKFRPVITTNFKTNIKPVGFCGQNKTCIYALSNLNRDKTALIEFNCATGKEDKEIYSSPDGDVIEGGYAFNKRKIIYATVETWKKERKFLNDSVKAIYDDLEEKLPNTEVRLFSRDSAEHIFVVNTFTDKTPGSYYLYTVKEKKLVKLGDANALLPEAEMCTMKPVSFKNRDGLTIYGYLTLPKGVDPSNLPVVVMPHSSPEARNSWGFNSEVQFLANRGYAVFQVNFRGSTGYGKKFYTAGFKNWGTVVQDDITDGVRWLIDTEIANPKKIAIYGTSFGGYSALQGLSAHPELYACGISYSGFTNLFTYIKSVPPYYKPYLQMYYEKVGNPEKDAEYFRAYSPIFHTDKIKAPLLLVQGAKDPRVNVNETNQFVRELKKRGVAVSYMLKQDQGHNFNNREYRLEFYRRLEKFLAENLNKK